MRNIHIHKALSSELLDPNRAAFEVVERKFRGHPDSMADLVAQSFTQKYIHDAWEKIPELSNTFFPNFSSDKVVLSGASTKYINNLYEIAKPLDALLIGKITRKIGKIEIDVKKIFRESVESVLTKCLGHENYKPYVRQKIYSVSRAGVDHNKGFYNPSSVSDLLQILKEETHANDTVYVVAYSPLSLTEKLAIHLDNLIASDDFREKFLEIGTDIKVMIRRRYSSFEITMCLPIFPEKVNDNYSYNCIIKKATGYLSDKIITFLNNSGSSSSRHKLKLMINTKDTNDKKYYALWGTSLSKGDIGAVGRGNRQQGFISGIRPSANEAMSGKNPNHFAGIVYQLVSENISKSILEETGLKNIVYITANNGDRLSYPNSIDIVLEGNHGSIEESIRKITKKALMSISQFRKDFINGDPYLRFMNPIIN